MKFKKFISKTFLRSSFFVFIFLAVLNSISSQVSCDGQPVTGCLKFPSQNYQCIVGDVNAQSLFGGQLLTQSQAQTSPQFLIVTGKITFSEDYTFASGSDIVFLNNNSGFRVAQNSSVLPKLTLNSSFLHGCTQLWAGIEVAPSATIIAKNCEFEDAKAAIILRNNSVAEITGNTFKKNVCGILGLPANPLVSSISILLASKRGISGNKFFGDQQLLQPATPGTIDPGINSDAPTSNTTNFPFAGIWIERVNALSIGFNTDTNGAPFNVFSNFGIVNESNIRTQGVRSIQSNVRIQNSVFSNFGAYDPMNSSNTIKSDAVFARNDGNVITNTIFTGVNLTAPIGPTNTFSNCYQDIRTLGTNLTVTYMTSFKAGQSISASTANSTQGSQVYKIQHNKIDYFRGYGIRFDADGNRLASTDIRLMDGTYSPLLNYPALTWEDKWQFADRLNRNPLMQTVDGVTSQYYQNTYNHTYSRLNRAYIAFQDRWQSVANMVGPIAALRTAVEQRFALDDALSLNAADNSNIYALMTAADTDISTKSAALKSASDIWVTDVDQNVNALLSDINSVSCTEDYEMDMKTVLTVMFQSHLSDGNLSQQQTALVAQIAAKCRYSGGYAVVLARGFFPPQDTYNQDKTCPVGDRNDGFKAVDISGEVVVYPNPASESFILDMGVDFSQGKLQIFNAQGTMVRSLNLTNLVTSVPVSDLPQGIYNLQIAAQNGKYTHKTFVVSK